MPWVQASSGFDGLGTWDLSSSSGGDASGRTCSGVSLPNVSQTEERNFAPRIVRCTRVAWEGCGQEIFLWIFPIREAVFASAIVAWCRARELRHCLVAVLATTHRRLASFDARRRPILPPYTEACGSHIRTALRLLARPAPIGSGAIAKSGHEVPVWMTVSSLITSSRREENFSPSVCSLYMPAGRRAM